MIDHFYVPLLLSEMIGRIPLPTEWRVSTYVRWINIDNNEELLE
jgi:hypothetical protein